MSRGGWGASIFDVAGTRAMTRLSLGWRGGGFGLPVASLARMGANCADRLLAGATYQVRRLVGLE